MSYSKYLLLLCAVGLCAPYAFARSVALAWDAPVSGGVAGYVLHWGTASKTYAQQIDVGNVTAYTLQATPDSAPLYAAVTDYDAANNTSTYSNEVFLAAVATPVPLATATPAPTPVPRVCPCTIWPSTSVPAVVENNDGQPIEVGVKFTVAAAGRVTAVRFYKGAKNTGAHAGHLWDASGKLLGSVAFTQETASGWQEAKLSTPVAVTAGVTYTVSYFSPSGAYSATWGLLTAAAGGSPLTAPRDTPVAANGTYIYGATGGFPTSTYGSSSYWVDLVYETGPVPTATPAADPSGLFIAGSGASLSISGPTTSQMKAPTHCKWWVNGRAPILLPVAVAATGLPFCTIPMANMQPGPNATRYAFVYQYETASTPVFKFTKP